MAGTNIAESFLESTFGATPDQASAIVWFVFFVIPTWYMVTKKERPDGIFWVPTAIGLLLEAPTHYAGGFEWTSLAYLADGAGAVYGTARSVRGLLKKKDKKD